MTLLLGLDIATTGAKALLIDAAGGVVSSATTPLALSTPHPLWAEQAPQDWWAGAVASIHQALAQAGVTGAAIGAVGLTGQMHGLVLLDAASQVLRPAILWNDQRTAAECDAIRARVGPQRLIQITGNDALPGFTAPKILWVAAQEPAIYARVAHLLLPKDYVRYRLTDDLALDKADGSGTLLFDLAARDWSPEVCAALAIPRAWLPPTYEGPAITGAVSAAAAAATGLRAGTPVVAGGGDQAAGAIGMGAVDPGVVTITLGTSGVVFAPVARPLVEPAGRLHAFCHAVPDRWHLMGVMLSAAGSLQWHHDTLAPDLAFATLLAEAATAPPGSEGLLFLPYLSGERTPHPDPLARGAWVGLTLRHRRAHLTRALLEGVAFGLQDSFALIRAAGLGAVQEVRVAGGGARSALWRQILADVLGVELVTVNTAEGAAYGAALLAGVAAGAWTDAATAAAATVQPGARSTPDSRTAAVYAQSYAEYQALYPALRPTFQRLG